MKKRMVLFLICLISGILFAGCGEKTEETEAENNAVEAGSLISFEYHPGYGDMSGAYHSESLAVDEKGNRIIVCRDCETFMEPVSVRTYAVTDDQFDVFESFIRERNILDLANRKDSDLFVTDYSPWEFVLVFDNSSVGGKAYETYHISEYKEYSGRDKELLKELSDRFHDLRGELLSETFEGEEQEPETEPVTEPENALEESGEHEDGAQETADYEAIYTPVLNEVSEFVLSGRDAFDPEKEYSYVSDGLIEKVMYPGDADLAEAVGYVMSDFSGDGIPELLIGCNENDSERGEVSYIFSAFTIKDNAPVSVFSGMVRSSYQYMGNDQFFYSGSGGASITLFGENHLSKDGTKIIWDDFYFSDEKEGGEIGLYHNTSGTFDAAASKELSMEQSEFFERMYAYEDRCELLPFTPIGEWK
ncbi:MAG: hypothetical protein K6F86_10995 [Lachnospiraceae bacterium]|nr:hypothetical protein [Lachnospiraceae bacterium]